MRYCLECEKVFIQDGKKLYDSCRKVNRKVTMDICRSNWILKNKNYHKQYYLKIKRKKAMSIKKKRDDFDLVKPKYYMFPICFNSAEDREEFKNAIHSLKTKTGISIGKLALQAIKELGVKK